VPHLNLRGDSRSQIGHSATTPKVASRLFFNSFARQPHELLCNGPRALDRGIDLELDSHETGNQINAGTPPVLLTNAPGSGPPAKSRTLAAASCDPLLTNGMATYGTIPFMICQNPGFAVWFDRHPFGDASVRFFPPGETLAKAIATGLGVDHQR
jgi:hypothetical protein